MFKKATARDPQKRYRSARAFADALEEVGILQDVDRARARLRDVALSARLRDQRKNYERAVRKVRDASNVDELEGALMRALEEPDRVERVDVEEQALLHADRLAADTTHLRAADPMESSELPAAL